MTATIQTLENTHTTSDTISSPWLSTLLRIPEILTSPPRELTILDGEQMHDGEDFQEYVTIG